MSTVTSIPTGTGAEMHRTASSTYWSARATGVRAQRTSAAVVRMEIADDFIKGVALFDTPGLTFICALPEVRCEAADDPAA